VATFMLINKGLGAILAMIASATISRSIHVRCDILYDQYKQNLPCNGMRHQIEEDRCLTGRIVALRSCEIEFKSFLACEMAS
jgi:hypothetical protein